MRTATVVLAYHALGVVSRSANLFNSFVATETFESQMDFLGRHRTVLGLDEILAGEASAGRPRVAITFDDGYRSVLTEAAPILRRHGFPATIFIPTKWIGKRNSWDPEEDLPLDIVSEQELLELREMGFEIGSHGHAHVDLSRATPGEAESDIRASVERLTEILGERPRYLSYPYGRSSEVARELAERAGFDAAFALGEEDHGRLAHERVSIYPFDRRSLFRFKTSGRYLRWRRSAIVASSYRRLRPLLRGGRVWR
jgi:peptidoglycan/xylan/chitin deacetylase (PgdA/CDA1 family)